MVFNNDSNINNNTISFSCNEFVPNAYIRKIAAVPGSNLYVFVWMCFLSSLNIAFRWKAQQALHFAETQQEKQKRRKNSQQVQLANNSSTPTANNNIPAAMNNDVGSSFTAQQAHLGSSYDDDDDDESDGGNNNHPRRHPATRDNDFSENNDYNYDLDDDDEFMDADSY